MSSGKQIDWSNEAEVFEAWKASGQKGTLIGFKRLHNSSYTKTESQGAGDVDLQLTKEELDAARTIVFSDPVWNSSAFVTIAITLQAKLTRVEAELARMRDGNGVEA